MEVKMEKRGMSAVVITVILVALSLVAITVVWTFVNNLVSQNADQAQLSSDCLKVTPRILNVIETGDGYNVTVEIPVQSGNPDGLKVYVGNVSKDAGNVDPGQSTTVSLNNVEDAEQAKVVAYFTINGEEKLCQGTVTESI